MDAQKGIRVQFGLECAERTAHQMRGRLAMQPHVIVGGFDPIDVLSAYEVEATTIPHDKALQISSHAKKRATLSFCNAAHPGVGTRRLKSGTHVSMRV